MLPTLTIMAALLTASLPPSATSPAPRFTLPASSVAAMRATLSVATSATTGAAPAAATTRREHHPFLAHTAIAAFMIGQFTDITTTEYGIGVGRIREGNPLFKWAVNRGPVPAGIAKGSFAVGVSWALLQLHPRHNVAACVTATVLTAVQGYVTWHNTRLLR